VSWCYCLDEANEIISMAEHNHESQINKIAKIKIIKEIKLKAIETSDKNNKIITDITSKLNDIEVENFQNYIIFEIK
jgi:hypothetical protein